MKVYIVCDTAGHDDEGMKKIARQLSTYADRRSINVKIINNKEIIPNFKDIDILHFIGGPTYRTILISGIIKLINDNQLFMCIMI